MMVTLTETRKKWAKRLGYPALGLISFVFALHYTFPYYRLEDQITARLSEYYDVSSVTVRPGWIPGHVVVKNLALKTRPDREGEKPVEFRVDELDLNIGFFALISGGFEVGIEAHIGDGKVTGSVRKRAGGAISLDFETADLPSQTIPGIKAATGGVPLSGGLSVRARINLPKGKWKEAQGYLSLACPKGCTIGDGIAKIRPTAPGQANAFTNEGFTLPKLNVGKIGGKVEIVKGVGRFENFETKSPDGELYLEGDIRFEDPFKRTQVTSYMRFKSSEELRKRETKMADMEKLMEPAGRRPDGFIGVRITGQISALRYLVSKTSPIPTKDKGAGGSPAKPVASATRPAARGVTVEPPAATPPTTPVATAEPVGDLARPAAPMPPDASEGDKERQGERAAEKAAADTDRPPPDERPAPRVEPPHDTDPDQPAQPPREEPAPSGDPPPPQPPSED